VTIDSSTTKNAFTLVMPKGKRGFKVDKQELKQNLRKMGIITHGNLVKKADIITALNKHKVIAALKTIVEAGFLEVETKFVKEAETEEVKEYLNKFKNAASKNKIKNLEEKNIDAWGKKPFKDFKKFVDNLEETKTAREVKKLNKMEGAELVASNEFYDVYNITTLEASCSYGSGTKWCTTNTGHFNEYKAEGVNFYYCISKTLGQEDDLYKVAIAVYPDKKEEAFDARDNSLSSIPEGIPNFKREYLTIPIMIDGKDYTTDISTWPLKIKGDLDLQGTPITSLPAGLTVGGDIYLYGTPIASLPAGLTVGGYLYLMNTPITSLPAGLTVGGDLDLRYTPITSLPAGLKVGGSLDLRDTPITSLPAGLTVGGNLNLRDTTIRSLPADLKVGGYLFLPKGFDKSKVPEHLRVN